MSVPQTATPTGGRPLLDLLSQLHDAGARLALDGDALDVRATGDALTPELRTLLCAHEADLRTVMRRQADDAAASSPADANADEDTGALPPILADFVAAAPADADDATLEITELAQRLDRLSGDARRATLFALVKDEAAAVLELAADDVEADAALTELGFDSLMAVELRDRLQAALGVRLSAAELWKDPWPGAIAERLLATWLLVRLTASCR